MLFGVLQPSGRTAWEHKRIPKGKIDQIVPNASRHCFFCDGIKVTNSKQNPDHDGEVIVCLIHACRDVCRDLNSDPSSKGPSQELAPCPSDRWCVSSDLVAGAKGREDSRKPSKVKINIEAAITLDEPKTFTSLPGSGRIEHHLHNYALQDVIVPLPDGVKLKLSSAKAIWDTPQCQHPQLLELYIDGSSTCNGSGWAIVAVVTDWCNVRSFLGCAAGQIEIEPQNPQWIGAQSKDNIAAEVSALVVAQVTALISNFPTIIRPDLQFSRHLVQGTQTTDKIGPIVEVSQLLAAWGAKHVQQVRAHKDDPFNELADSLAKWAADTGESCGSVPFCTPHEIASRHDRSSLWIHTMPHCFAGTMPVRKDGNFLAFNSNRKVNHDTDHHSDPNDTAGEFACKVVTFNAQSIREDKKNQMLPRRDTAITSRLDLQWHSGGAAIVGIQESRTPEGSFRSRHYEIFSSGADQTHDCPHFGCEVWFHKQIPIVSFSDRRYFSADFKKVVVHKDPRRLVVRCSSDPMTFVVASLHAPCLSQGTTIHQIKHWWNETCSILQKIGNCCHLMLCVDANAPLGPDGNSVIGQCGAETNNAQSHVVHEAIDKLDVCVPSTCPDCHVGPTATWRHPKGKWMRRDYVLVSRTIQSWCQKSYVDLSFDSGKSHIDHLPVTLEMRGFVQGVSFSKPPKIDVSKVSNPECRHAFQQALSTMPLPTWDVDIDSHCKIWESNVLELAQQVFRPDPPKKKKHRPQLTETTLQAIAFKRHILQLMRFAEGQQHDEYKEVLREVEKDVRQKVAKDQICWYDEFLNQLQESGDIHDSKAVFAKLHRLGGGKRAGKIRPLPMMKDHHGQSAQSFEQSQKILFEQFATIEGGKLLTDDDLRKFHKHSDIVDLAVFDPDLVPTLSQVRQVIAGMKKGKVPGPNGITTDVLKAGGVEIAKQMIPLLTKCTLHCSEPLSWKGGNLVALFKGKGSYADPKAYRSIFISDVTAKVFHANLRSKLDAAWMKSMDALQFGGRKGCSPDFAHHILHSFLAWSKVKRMPAAAVFVDLRSAFYSVLRQGLFEGEISDQHVCQAMAQLGVSPEEFHEIASTVHQEAATAGVGPHADLLFRNLFCATHFRMAAIDQPCHTAKGTRPGDPVADVLFNMSMMLILRSVRAQVNCIADFSNVVGSVVATTVAAPVILPPKGYLDVAFVDDCVFMTFAPSNEQMMQQTKLLQSVFHDEARKRGLSVNYEKGKTEVIVQCCGPNTRFFKKNLLIEGKASVPIVCENETYQLRVVHGYKHLGSFVQEGASIEWDRRKKVAQARQAWWTLKRSFFSKKAISSHVKTTVFNAIVKSRALYNAHVWSWISPKDVEHWNDSVREMFSPIVKRQLQASPAFKYTSAQLCALAGILDFQDQLHVNRLMYLHRMMEKAPAILWTFIVEVEAPQGWLQQLRSSFQWLVDHFPGHLPFAMEEETVDIIQKVALDGRWRAKVKRASRSAVAYYKRQADGLIWTRCMQAKLEVLGCLKEVSEKPKLVCWQCELCDAGFDSKRGLAMHSHSVHGYLREAKHYIVDDKCNACGKIFHTRARAIAHVESNPRCMQCYRSCMVPVDEETMQQVEDADRMCRKEMREQGWKPTKALKPIIRMVGPTFPPSGTVDAEEMRRKWTRRVESTNRATFLQGFLSGQGEEQVGTVEGPPFILDTVGGEISGHGGCAPKQSGLFGCASQLQNFFLCPFFQWVQKREGSSLADRKSMGW